MRPAGTAALLRSAHCEGARPACIAATLRPPRLRACRSRGRACAHVGAQHRHLRRGDDPAVDGDGLRRGGVDHCAARTAPWRRTTAAAGAGHGVCAVSPSASSEVGVVGARVAQTASAAKGVRRRVPLLRHRAARAKPDNPARLLPPTAAPGGYVIDRLWPRIRARITGGSISLGASVFADYELHRRRCRHRSGRPALQLLDLEQHHRSCCTAHRWAADRRAIGSAHRSGRRSSTTRDNGMLLFLRGDASWADDGSCAEPANS